MIDPKRYIGDIVLKESDQCIRRTDPGAENVKKEQMEKRKCKIEKKP